MYRSSSLTFRPTIVSILTTSNTLVVLVNNRSHALVEVTIMIGGSSRDLTDTMTTRTMDDLSWLVTLFDSNIVQPNVICTPTRLEAMLLVANMKFLATNAMKGVTTTTTGELSAMAL